MRKVSPREKQEALDRLREWMPAGSTVYCVLRKRSRSGMQREIGLVVMVRDGASIDLRHPNYSAGVVLGLRVNEAGSGLVVRGCGMDMGWHLVRRLSEALYGPHRADALRAEWI